MTALGSLLSIFAAYGVAIWIGYQIGMERGIQKERTKRRWVR